MSDPTTSELHRIIVRLSLMSHAPIQGYNFAPSDVGRGERWRTGCTRPPIAHLGQHSPKGGDTMIPRGSIDRMGDFTDEYRQKSHVYFARKLMRARTSEQRTRLLEEARQALRDWMHTPQVAGVELERDSFLWKCAIADDDRKPQSVMDSYSISRATFYRYRAKYRGLQRVSDRAV